MINEPIVEALANQSLPPRNGGSRKKRSTRHAERDGDKRSLTEPAVDDFTRVRIGFTIGHSLPRAERLPWRRCTSPIYKSINDSTNRRGLDSLAPVR
jgi:hypothetical protein